MKHIDEESGQVIFSGMGELHLEIIIDRMKMDFNIDVNVGDPQVAYRETIRNTVEQEFEFIRQAGDKRQYAHVWLRIEPQESGYEFVNQAISKEYVKAVDAGIQEQLKSGIMFGYPVLNVKVSLLNAAFDEDSSELTFKIAGAMCFKEAAIKACPILLEPIMKVEIVTPEEYMGDVINDITKRRGMILSMGDIVNTITCEVPLSEMFGYSTSLRSETQGRATYSMRFEKYTTAPSRVSNKYA